MGSIIHKLSVIAGVLYKILVQQQINRFQFLVLYTKVLYLSVQFL